ncbi:MAG: GAF domain-containing sensor histidine kinase [Bradymonadaceae bacterium]|nr:GAF domain-containing sensor histidine kinase [Lujinxingiaceae bacterium]
MRMPPWTPILYDIAQALESVEDPQTRIHRVLTLLEAVVPYRCCGLLEAASLLSRPITIVPMPPEQDNVAALKHRLDKMLALLVEDAVHDHRTLSTDSAVHLAVPIFSLGETIGILYVERPEPYAETHLAFLSIVAAQLGAYLTVLKAEAEKSALLEQRERDVVFLQIFVAMLGHDLRNPLTAIQMLAGVLRKIEGERLAGPLDRILSSTDRMVRMVDQLLDLTRIRLAAGILIERSNVTLAEVCDQAIDEIRAAKPDKAAIQLEVQGDTSGCWDVDRLLQVVSNLVANAVEHAQAENPVLVHVAGNGDNVELRVYNRGFISPQLIPVIFEPFHDEERRQKAAGLGLGLFIVKHIVDAHGGTVRVASSQSEGTTFTVRLPRTAKQRSV